MNLHNYNWNVLMFIWQIMMTHGHIVGDHLLSPEASTTSSALGIWNIMFPFFGIGKQNTLPE
jgi:hypothetical protein